MATSLWRFAESIPAGTQIASYVTRDLVLPPTEVVRIRIRIPPGPNGNLGVALGSAGTPVIPRTLGTWLVMTDEILDWRPNNALTSGAWQLFAYNTGTLDHVAYVDLFTDPVGTQATVYRQPVVVGG